MQRSVSGCSVLRESRMLKEHSLELSGLHAMNRTRAECLGGSYIAIETNQEIMVERIKKGTFLVHKLRNESVQSGTIITYSLLAIWKTYVFSRVNHRLHPVSRDNELTEARNMTKIM